MIKPRILLFLFIVGSTAALYSLPRYTVNDSSQHDSDNNPLKSVNASDAQLGDIDHNHAAHLPDSMANIFKRLHESFKNAENQEKRIIFADSLAKAYKIVKKFDSLARFTELIAIENPSMDNLITAGDGYYTAFNYAVTESKRKMLGEKARQYYLRVLEENPSLLDVKSKLAMTYVSGSNPMQGIAMLKEVLAEDQNNQLSIYNLGLLAINSGQMNKAIERFEKLEKLNPEDPEAHFYLGYCNFQLGNNEIARMHFQKVQELGIMGDMMDSSKEYLKRIN